MNNLILIIIFLVTVPTFQAEKDYTDLVNFLKKSIQLPFFKHSGYNRLAYLTDSFGPRMWGS